MQSVKKEPVHGSTVTKAYDGLLDIYVELRHRQTEAIKLLGKLEFIHPETRRSVQQIIKVLEGKK